jgi:DNA-binding transcriptional ArsR family regulator
MPRAATTSDVFNAIAEPRRRDIIDFLARGQHDGHAVGALVAALRLPQPAVSKHLSVLSRVGIVSNSRHGRQRIYRLNAKELKPVHDWARQFERYWSHQIGRIKDRAERTSRERSADSNQPHREKKSS